MLTYGYGQEHSWMRQNMATRRVLIRLVNRENVVTWHTSPVKTIEDAMKREATLSGTGAGSTASVYPLVLNNVRRMVGLNRVELALTGAAGGVVYLNGTLLGIAKSGFTPFGFDLTPHLKLGAANVLAVMADNRFMKDPLDPKLAPQAATTSATHPNLAQLSKELMEKIPATLEELQADQIPWNNPHWHPAHGGIYRNVRLIVTDALHFDLPLYSFLQTEGPYAYATGITEKSAQIGLEIPVRNDGQTAADGEIRAELLDADGKSVWREAVRVVLPAGGYAKVKLGSVYVNRPGEATLLQAAPPLTYAAIKLNIRAGRWARWLGET